LPNFNAIEGGFSALIYEKFLGRNVTTEEAEAVRDADDQAAIREADMLLPHGRNSLWQPPPVEKVPYFDVHCWEPAQAGEELMKRWRWLLGEDSL
jgi:hypothetical protein